MVKEPRVLIYDIETFPLQSWHFSLGKQVLRHGALVAKHDAYDIITIQYQWADKKKVHNLSWLGINSDSSAIIKQFDTVVRQADILIGKNSDRFDSKHINTMRLIHGLPQLPDWATPRTRDDVEKQMRKWFYLPSNSLDYIAKLLLKEGKVKMDFSDWISISLYKEVLNLRKDILEADGYDSVEDADINIHLFSINAICNSIYGKDYSTILLEGQKSLAKMIKYGNKDTSDTTKIYHKIKQYCSFKPDRQRFAGHQDGNYLRCGLEDCKGDRTNIRKNGVDYRGQVPKQRLFCEDCRKHCGYAVYKRKVTLIGR